VEKDAPLGSVAHAILLKRLVGKDPNTNALLNADSYLKD
jgi:hypothetical protein